MLATHASRSLAALSLVACIAALQAYPEPSILLNAEKPAIEHNSSTSFTNATDVNLEANLPTPVCDSSILGNPPNRDFCLQAWHGISKSSDLCTFGDREVEGFNIPLPKRYISRM